MSGNLLKTCDFVNLCRVCGKQSNKMISLFGIRKKGLMLAEMLSICTQSRVKQTDRFPSNICNQCLSNLEVAFDFYNLVKTSEDRFQKIISIEDSKRKVHSIDLCATPEDANEYVKAELNDEPQENSHHLILDEDHEQKPAAKIVALKVPPDEIQAYQRLLHDKKMHRLFECFMCKAKLKTFKDMRSHLKRHNEATPFKCKICQMLFSAQQYEQHLCKGQSVQCSYCPETFQTTKSLLDHLQGHEEQHNLHKCPDCSKLFPMMFLLDCHRAQHGQIERPYVCHICNRGFRVKFLLTKHLSTHSNERRKFNTPLSYSTEQMLCHSNSTLYFLAHLCSTCGMGFKTMGTLRSHAIRHSGFKPVACSKCPKRFFSKADLRKHMDVHSDAKYVCNLCGASLSSKRSLDEHRSSTISFHFNLF